MKYLLIITLIMISTVSFSQNPNQKKGIFKQYDKNNDGKISLNEFSEFYQKTNSSVKFAVLDANKDNFLDRQDFKNLAILGKNKKKDKVFEIN